MADWGGWLRGVRLDTSLRPYRGSSPMDPDRAAFGVLAPEAWSEAGGSEAWWMEAQFPLETSGCARLDATLRFLQLERRAVARSTDGGATFHPADELEGDGRSLVPCDEGRLREVPFTTAVSDLLRGEVWAPFELPAGTDAEVLRDRSGAVVGRIARTRARVSGTVRLSAGRVGGRDDLLCVRVRIENVTPWVDASAPRAEAIRASCLSTHLVLSVRGGAFVSLLDPPEDAREAVAQCRSVRAFPVLAGEPGSRDLLLSAPIALCDHPRL